VVAFAYGPHEITGERRGFFFEYFVTNPSLGGDEPVFGQTPANRSSGRGPSYAMLNAGTWGTSPRQIHNYYGINDSAFNSEHVETFNKDNLILSRHRCCQSAVGPGDLIEGHERAQLQRSVAKELEGALSSTTLRVMVPLRKLTGPRSS
jgi:hypothetical protein